MKFDRMAPWGIAAALACLGGCDPHPKPNTPKTESSGTPAGVFATTALNSPMGTTALVPAGDSRGALGTGAGLRPSRGASGIAP